MKIQKKLKKHGQKALVERLTEHLKFKKFTSVIFFV
jgi:hypothetical protein